MTNLCLYILCQKDDLGSSSYYIKYNPFSLKIYPSICFIKISCLTMFVMFIFGGTPLVNLKQRLIIIITKCIQCKQHSGSWLISKTDEGVRVGSSGFKRHAVHWRKFEDGEPVRYWLALTKHYALSADRVAWLFHKPRWRHHRGCKGSGGVRAIKVDLCQSCTTAHRTTALPILENKIPVLKN